jgi:Tol biopolymer transport system component
MPCFRLFPRSPRQGGHALSFPRRLGQARTVGSPPSGLHSGSHIGSPIGSHIGSQKATRRRGLGACLAWCLVALASPVSAFTLNRNEAHLKWKSAETEHFRFHYPKELEEPAEYIAGIAEAVAQEKLDRYRLKFSNKSEFVVRQDIFSNGWANSLQNTMTVWVTDWDFPIRSTHNWLRDVVTHEFSHLVSIQSGSKLPSYWQGLIVGYDDYFNEPTQKHIATIIPFMNYPNWFAEGVAQYESEISGFDAWDSHRDMLLRVALRENKMLSLARMGSFAGTSLEYELGPYTQGFALTRFIAEKYGDASVLKLWFEMSRMHRQTLSGAMERVIGKDGDAVYNEWQESLRQRYDAQAKSIGAPVTGDKLTSDGFYHYYPRYSHDGKSLFMLSNLGRDDFRGSLILYDLSDSAMKKKEEERFKVIAGVRSYYDIAADDSTVIYNSAKEQDKNGVAHFDIYQRNVRLKPPFNPFAKNKTEKRYTENLDAVHPAFSPDGKQVAFVRAEVGNFKLCLAPVPEGKKLDADEVKTLWPSDAELKGRFGFNLYTPKFSPDGKNIVFSYFDGTTRNIGRYDLAKKQFVPLLTQGYDERDPVYSPDGKWLYFSADSGNIYNIYRIAASHSDSLPVKPEAVTRVMGGAFAPAISPDGKRLAYVGYDKDGFNIYQVPEIKALSLPGEGYQVRHNDTLATDPQVLASKSRKYSPTPNRPILTPLLFGQEASSATRLARQGEPKWFMGLSGMINDPLMKNEASAALLLEVGNGFDYVGNHPELLAPEKESQFFLAWRNHSTPVSLGTAFSRGNMTTSDTFTVRDRTPGSVDVETQHYALTYRDVNVTAGYDLFDATSIGEDAQSSFFQLTGGYGWNSFHFYDNEDGEDASFSFDYYQTTYLNALVWLYGAEYNDKSLVAPAGMAAYASYTLSQSGLLRSGTFQESFVVTSNGILKPLMREYALQELDIGATFGTEMPWSKNSSLAVSAFGSTLGWDFTNRRTGSDPDTLDDFFTTGLWLRGYPYLRDIEHLSFSGANTLKFSVDLNQPLLPNIYSSSWIFFFEDLYLTGFWEAGRAWNTDLWETDLLRADTWRLNGGADAWYQSVGWGLKLNARIYHHFPFLVFFEAATALSDLPNGKGGHEPLESITLPFIGGHNNRIDTYATRIQFGVAFGIYNGLLGDFPKPKSRPQKASHPAKPTSFFGRL